MKAILVPVEDHDSMPAVLETAQLVARRFDGCIEGFAIYPVPGDFVAVDPLSNLTLPHGHTSEAEIETHARSAFETFMRTHGVPGASPQSPGQQQQATYSWCWSQPAAQVDAFIGSYGRLFDLIVLGRPGRGPQDPRMAPLETALFESGRPVLIAPRVPPPDIGRNVLIAWNGSTEQARTTAFAMPLLREARQVTVLTVEGGMTPGPAGEDMARHLRLNGLPATAVTIAPGTRTTGEAILEHARALGCDLLVKGAYTQSRLRQIMFGGATRHILAHATLPVLMAH
jgi:nucleotide-binding universal stress UspA family protein